MTDDLRTRITAVLGDELFVRGAYTEYGTDDEPGDWARVDGHINLTALVDAVIRELNTNCVGYQIWNAAEWISDNSGWVPYEIYRNVDGSGGGWRVTVQRIEADDD